MALVLKGMKSPEFPLGGLCKDTVRRWPSTSQAVGPH